MSGMALDQPHGAPVGVRKDRLGAMLGDDPAPALADPLNGLRPADGGKGPAALGPRGQQRAAEPARGVHRLLVAGHLGAQAAAAMGMLGVALDR